MIAPLVTPQWVPHPRHDPDRARDLARDLDAPLAAAQALVNRGLDDSTKVQRYLAPSLEDLHDPFALRDLDRAVERIDRAIANGERILIHGDYDVDGITSTYLLYSVLQELGGRVDFRIPHRTRDGYGLSHDGMADAHRRGCTLVITVDCGITAAEPIARARGLGIDTIVTDHHEPPLRLPDAVAVVNPLRPGCGYPFKSLAGVGVTFKLVQALLRGHGGLERAGEFLDIVAIGTIADVVPLVGENRVLARLGLDRLNRSHRAGLRALIEVAGLAGKQISSGQVAFVLAPRINAAGRMGNAEQGLRLLLSRDAAEARVFAESLEEDNDRRRRIDEEVLVDAARIVETELEWPSCGSILLWSEKWHPGVIGIVASRLVERYQRPTVLVSLNGATGRGSGRSMPGLDLNEVLGHCEDLLVAFGGHAFAAGLTVQREQLPALRDRFDVLVRERLSLDDCVPRLKLDGEMRFSDCDLRLAEWLERLSPHGLANEEPVYLTRDVTVVDATTVGGGRHLRMRLRDETGVAEAIGFGFGSRIGEVVDGRRCDLAYVPTRSEWMGEARVQLKLKGVRAA